METSLFSFTFLVAALGYLVDIYDTVLFSVIRTSSLLSLGLSREEITRVGSEILRLQMTGVLLGAFFWGVLGDRKGRRTVILGSILIYSLGTLLNGFVTSIEQYKWIRLLSGFGLAGELGAAITLVNEILDRNRRGYGATVIAAIGGIGAIAAALIGERLNWRTAYITGGISGFAILLLRSKMIESGMFEKILDKDIPKGELFLFFSSPKRLLRYCCCILIGLPVWYSMGIVVVFSPELARALNVTSSVSAGKTLLWFYSGFTIGDICSGVLCQFLKNRKKVLLGFLVFTAFCLNMIWLNHGLSTFQFYLISHLLGFGVGYWVLFAMISSEQFGVNFRSTVTTTTPQLLRATVIPMTLLMDFLRPNLGFLSASIWIGVGCLVLATIASLTVEETFGRELNFVELEN